MQHSKKNTTFATDLVIIQKNHARSHCASRIFFCSVQINAYKSAFYKILTIFFVDCASKEATDNRQKNNTPPTGFSLPSPPVKATTPPFFDLGPRRHLP